MLTILDFGYRPSAGPDPILIFASVTVSKLSFMCSEAYTVALCKQQR